VCPSVFPEHGTSSAHLSWRSCVGVCYYCCCGVQEAGVCENMVPPCLFPLLLLLLPLLLGFMSAEVPFQLWSWAWKQV
jgi:hypothetical protein